MQAYGMEESESELEKEGEVLVSRRSLLEAIGLAVLAGGTLTGTAAAANGVQLQVQPQPVTQQSEYRGIARTVVLAGDGLTTTEHTYEHDVVVVVGPPRGAPGGLMEDGPFNLFIGPGDPNETGQPGRWEIHSALLSGSVLFQFWEYELFEDGTFTGVLTDPHNQEAIAANLIDVETPLIPGRPNLGMNTLPKAMGKGTRLSGRGSDDAVSIHLVGTTIDQFTRFESRIEATRVA